MDINGRASSLKVPKSLIKYIILLDMQATGFYIHELRVTGLGKKNAIVKFNKGFNLISVLSDTGKSYVFSCFEYMLVSTIAPTSIPASTGYSDLFLEIFTFCSF